MSQKIENQYSNIRNKIVELKYNEETIIDSFAIIPNTLNIIDLDTSFYEINYNKSVVKLKKYAPNNVTNFQIIYRIFPLNLYKKYEFINHLEIDTNGIVIKNFQEFQAEKSLSDVLDMGGLNYSGSFGRGMSFGNKQDVVLNSNLNLQISGYLSDSILLNAAISDNNIPFQPEGNTQQLQEFDKIFIQLKKRANNLIIGDHEIFKPKGYFMNFYKRNQGLYYTNDFVNKKNIKWQGGVDLSVAKGRFTRNIITPKDGNQGPYRLTASDGELYFIVVANSERVYIDGVLQKRGENADYTIDYNSGEIKFMPKRLINKDLRLIVEFEYLNRNYINSLIYTHQNVQFGEKLNFYTNIYSNQDAKNQPINVELTDSQKIYLMSIGDSTQKAFVDNYIESSFNTTEAFYRKIDTTVNGILYQNIYEYMLSNNATAYKVNFTYVGEGKGDYTISSSNINQRIFVWKPPINGISQGDYTPKTLLITPKKQQMLNMGMEYSISKNQKLKTEISFTDNNPNTFSTIHNDINKGYAGSLDYEQNIILKKDSSHNTAKAISISNHSEYLSAAFKPIVRYRNPEFERDWGNSNISTYTAAQEFLNVAALKFNSISKGSITFENSFYKKDSIFSGLRNSILIDYNLYNFKISSNTSLLNGKDSLYNIRYFRPNLKVVKTIWKKYNWNISSEFQKEKNQKLNTTTDTILAQSYNFNVYNLYTNFGNAEKNLYKIGWFRRTNFKAQTYNFTTQDIADNFNSEININSIKNQNIQLNGTYRILHNLIDSLGKTNTTNTLVGRVQYNGKLIKGFIQNQLIYELGTGQEQKKTYSFVQVATGQGQYYWNDYNGDSLQQINEFEIALYQDQAKFIKIYTPTNDYVNSNFLNFNYVLNINPALLFNKNQNENKLFTFISKFNSQTSIQISNKEIVDKNQVLILPKNGGFTDSNLISSLKSINQLVYFNRTNSKWSLTYNYIQNQNKSLLNYGIESRNLISHTLNSRYNITKSMSWKTDFKNIEKGLYSPYLGFENRNYKIKTLSAYSILSNVYRTNFRSNLSFGYEQSKNILGTELAKTKEIQEDLKWNIGNKYSVNTNFTYKKIEYNGEANTTLGYVILNGLNKGNNFLWKVNMSQKILKNVEMYLEYEGRKSGISPMVHIGRATVRAVF